MYCSRHMCAILGVSRWESYVWLHGLLGGVHVVYGLGDSSTAGNARCWWFRLCTTRVVMAPEHREQAQGLKDPMAGGKPLTPPPYSVLEQFQGRRFVCRESCRRSGVRA